MTDITQEQMRLEALQFAGQVYATTGKGEESLQTSSRAFQFLTGEVQHEAEHHTNGGEAVRDENYISLKMPLDQPVGNGMIMEFSGLDPEAYIDRLYRDALSKLREFHRLGSPTESLETQTDAASDDVPRGQDGNEIMVGDVWEVDVFGAKYALNITVTGISPSGGLIYGAVSSGDKRPLRPNQMIQLISRADDTPKEVQALQDAEDHHNEQVSGAADEPEDEGEGDESNFAAVTADHGPTLPTQDFGPDLSTETTDLTGELTEAEEQAVELVEAEHEGRVNADAEPPVRVV